MSCDPLVSGTHEIHNARVSRNDNNHSAIFRAENNNCSYNKLVSTANIFQTAAIQLVHSHFVAVLSHSLHSALIHLKHKYYLQKIIRQSLSLFFLSYSTTHIFQAKPLQKLARKRERKVHYSHHIMLQYSHFSKIESKEFIMPETKNSSAGLAGIIAGQSAISMVGHNETGLHYRGYEIHDLTQKSSFEAVAYLLIYGELPTAAQLTDYQNTLISLRDLPITLKEVLEKIPVTAHPMDVLRTGCSFLGTLEPENKNHNQIDIANKLIACFPAMLTYWFHFQHNHKKINTQLNDKTTGEYFLHLLHGEKPDALQTSVLNTSLILYAEHEFNASTFTARVIAATLSDFYSCITGANEEALKLILQFNSVAAAEKGVMEMLRQKKLIMGFGHRVYKNGDPRSDIIKAEAKKLSEKLNDHVVYAVSEVIEKLMRS